MEWKTNLRRMIILIVFVASFTLLNSVQSPCLYRNCADSHTLLVCAGWPLPWRFISTTELNDNFRKVPAQSPVSKVHTDVLYLLLDGSFIIAFGMACFWHGRACATRNDGRPIHKLASWKLSFSIAMLMWMTVFFSLLFATLLSTRDVAGKFEDLVVHGSPFAQRIFNRDLLERGASNDACVFACTVGYAANVITVFLSVTGLRVAAESALYFRNRIVLKTHAYASRDSCLSLSSCFVCVAILLSVPLSNGIGRINAGNSKGGVVVVPMARPALLRSWIDLAPMARTGHVVSIHPSKDKQRRGVFVLRSLVLTTVILLSECEDDEAIAAYLTNNRFVNTLYLRTCRVGKTTAEHIFHLSGTRHIVFTECSIDAGCLATVLQNKHLTSVVVDRCNIDAGEAAVLMSRFRDILTIN